MKTRFVLPLVICVFMTIGSATVVSGGAGPASNAVFLFTDSPYESLYKMDEIGAALYGAANDNNRQYAYAQVKKLQKAIGSEMDRAYGNQDGWEEIEGDLAMIETSLARGASTMEWRDYAARIRLALDAVIGGSGSLWLQYEALLREDVQLIGQALKRSTDDRAAAASSAEALLATMKTHVNRIGAAAAISGHGLRMEELRKRMDYSGKLIASTMSGPRSSSMAAMRAAVQSLEDAKLAIDDIFRKDEAAAAVPAMGPPNAVYSLQWAFFIGTMISAVLTFVGWRKYKQTPYGVKPIE